MRQILYSIILISSFFLSSCQKDGEKGEVIPQTVASYSFTPYAVEGRLNRPVSGAALVNYAGSSVGAQVACDALKNNLRIIFGSVLPQIMQRVNLKDDGSVSLNYYPNSSIVFNSQWVIVYPTPAQVAANFPQVESVESPSKYAAWSEHGEIFYVKPDLMAIIKNINPSQGGGSGSGGAGGSVSFADMLKILNAINTGNPTKIKDAFSSVLGLDISAISDESVVLLHGWLVKTGVPFKVRRENGHRYLYLTKEDLNPLVAMHTDQSGAKLYDIVTLWNMIINSGLIADETLKSFGIYINTLATTWPNSTMFELGFDFADEVIEP